MELFITVTMATQTMVQNEMSKRGGYQYLRMEEEEEVVVVVVVVTKQTS
jgi:hypothetical protein